MDFWGAVFLFCHLFNIFKKYGIKYINGSLGEIRFKKKNYENQFIAYISAPILFKSFVISKIYTITSKYILYVQCLY